ncbi:tyrosine-type recombinase/integrase [Ralstonia wenshanensis]|uniref:Tyr recombinase domain-containing protein n=1 Tax=Ralstonia wenshanensis TaxID=2842456 RepID=A0AAD2EIZ1_9RALS|nr:integrase family protein [Ralstonia wenshanensis]CAJ0688347.1 hypothetical protein LMG18091_00924 [Ralstonia wenshanensis]
MARVNFTAKRVGEHYCPEGKAQAFLWDKDVPGLGLRATAKGAKAYIFQSKLHGQTVRVTIGDLEHWPIEKARLRARDLQMLIDAGKDPREYAAEQRAAHEARKAEARRQDVTFGGAWDVYIESRKPHWSARSYADHVRHAAEGGKAKLRGPGLTVAGPLASLRPLKLSALTGERVAAWLEAEAVQRPTMTALSYRLLRGFVRWAGDTPEYRGVIPADAYTARGVRDALPKVSAKEGDCLQREQLPAWFAAVRQLGNPVIAAYLQTLLLTGARREELAGLQWSDVDFQWGSLTIRDKVEGERTIPLTPYLAFLLAALPRRNEWVFSSPAAADGKIAEPRIAHTKALEVAGLPHVSLHGLRRSFGTLCEWVEMPSGISAQIMGHKPSALAEKHYRRRPLDLLRMWHTKIEAWMLEQACIEFSIDGTKVGLRAVQ